MANTTTTKKTETTKKVAPKTTSTPKTTTKKEPKKVVEKKNRERKTLTVDQVVEIMNNSALNIYNAQAKGNYRIIGGKSGSSLNIQTQKYILFSTDTDFEALSALKDKCKDLVLEKGANSQDKCRPNAIKFTEKTTLESVIKLMAKTHKVAASK